MIKYTKTTLKKIEDLFRDLEYKIRYEKGHFQSGYCMVENQKVAVINKFYDTEARINCLIEILSKIDITEIELTESSKEMYNKISKEHQLSLDLAVENNS
ncbi:MAG: hypothetical protein AAGK97_16785 [Bacteroidota bacterium]